MNLDSYVMFHILLKSLQTYCVTTGVQLSYIILHKVLSNSPWYITPPNMAQKTVSTFCTKLEKATLGYVRHFLSQYLLNLTSSYCEVGLLCGRFCTSKYCLQLAQLSTGYCLMRYPAMYVTMFCFSIDAASIAAIIGSIAHLLSDGSFT